MKKMIVLIAALLTINSAAKAQEKVTQPVIQDTKTTRPHKTPEERARKDAERAQQKLGLDASQTAKWEAASLERLKANEPFREQMKSTTEKTEKQKIAAQMKPNLKKFDDTVNGFLTPDQKTKWEQMKSEKKNARHHRDQKMQQAPNTN